MVARYCSVLHNVAQFAYVLLLLHIVDYDCVLFLLVFDLSLVVSDRFLLFHVVSKCGLLLQIAANSSHLLLNVAYC